MEEMSNKTTPQYICDFDGFTVNFSKPFQIVGEPIGETSHELVPCRKIYATFFKDENEFMCNVSAYDYCLITPDNPIKINQYELLYDFILNQMKRFNGDTAHEVPEVHRTDFLNHIKNYQTPEAKEQFLKCTVLSLIKFEEIKPIVKEFVDKFLSENKEYKYATVYSSNIYS